MSPTARVLALAAAATILSWVSLPLAQDDERVRARTLANDGLALFDQGNYQGALEKFQAAEEIVHAPPHLLYVARAHAELGHLLESRSIYQRIVDEDLGASAPKAFREAQARARTELEQLSATIPELSITIDGPLAEQARVYVDGEEVNTLQIPVDSGEHVVSAEADGYRREETRVSVSKNGGVTQVRLTLRALTHEGADNDDDIPLGPILLMAGGGALLVVGAVTGGLALSRASELRDACPTNPCATANEDLKDEATTFATVSTATLAIGGAALAAGVGWLIFDLVESDDGDSAIDLRLGPASAAIAGSF